jgi:hypothetical protein
MSNPDSLKTINLGIIRRCQSERRYTLLIQK